MSVAEAAAYRRANERCGMTSSNFFEPVLSPGSALFGRWMDVVAQIDAGAQFQQALTGWRSCTERAGIPVSDIYSFFSYVDRQERSSPNGGVQSKTEDLRLASIYARCLGPAEQLRDQLRLEARSAFFDAHAGVINQLSTDANRLVANLEAKYSVKWGR
jgi:hypothetical protein